jgi:hypothetical protein
MRAPVSLMYEWFIYSLPQGGSTRQLLKAEESPRTLRPGWSIVNNFFESIVSVMCMVKLITVFPPTGRGHTHAFSTLSWQSISDEYGES